MTPKDKIVIDLIKICKEKGVSMSTIYDIIVNRADISPQTKRNQIKLYEKLKQLL
jgi:hypothetical protein